MRDLAACPAGRRSPLKPYRCRDTQVRAATPSTIEIEAMSEVAQPAKIEKSDAEWKRELTPEQYRITRQHGTERPWTGPDRKSVV